MVLLSLCLPVIERPLSSLSVVLLHYCADIDTPTIQTKSKLNSIPQYFKELIFIISFNKDTTLFFNKQTFLKFFSILF